MKIFLLLCFFIYKNSLSTEYLFCNSCTSKVEFVNYAKGHHGNSGGTVNYQVINYVTEELWDVTVERSFEPEINLYLNFAFGSVSSQEDINDFKLVKELVAQKDFLVMMPPGTGGFQGYAPREVSLAVTTHPTYTTLIQKKAKIFAAIKLAFNFGEVFAVVVFENGDVAKFKVVNFTGGAACCTLVQNSGRDINGNIIGGSGNGGSGDYVQPITGSPGHIIIVLTPSIKFDCWKIPTGVMCRRI